jgi:hypothetical protein
MVLWKRQFIIIIIRRGSSKEKKENSPYMEERQLRLLSRFAPQLIT